MMQADFTEVDGLLAAVHGPDCAQFADITGTPLETVDQMTATAISQNAAGDFRAAFCSLDDATWQIGPTIYHLDRMAPAWSRTGTLTLTCRPRITPAQSRSGRAACEDRPVAVATAVRRAGSG
ncbi:hypothetical protein [Streptomyces sp. NBC_01190]|uniref:hypothetical protein n=1 Tax=Streptomyces sp. NBC_01190 TaxID=2903767 RepID=UPI003862E195|nr:hypothetical protein OG519_29745 [Streptomyces sp. NBC_01190]